MLLNGAMSRILFVLKDTTTNGLTREVEYFARELPKLGCDVFAASWRAKRTSASLLTLSTDRLLYCDADVDGVAAALPRLVSWITRSRPDIVYAYLDSLPALRALAEFKHRIRFVKAEGRKIMEWSRERIQLYKVLAPAFHQVVVTSTSMRDRFYQAGLDARNVVLLESAVDTDLFRPSLGALNPKRLVGISSGQSICLNVARMAEHKRPSLFARIAKLVVTKLHSGERPPMFVWLGAPANARRFQRLRETLGVQFSNTSLTPELWYPAAEVFLMTSENESCPNSLLEAMSSGLPVVTTRSYGSIGELVVDGTGFIVDNIADAAAAVSKLLINAKLRSDMGKKARHAVVARHSLSQRVARFRNIFLS